MKGEAYYKGEREYSYYGLCFDKNPYHIDSQDYEDYRAGMNMAHKKTPALDARIK